MPRSRRRPRLVASALAVTMLLAACAGDGEDPADTPGDAATAPDADALSVAVASFDLAVGDDRRLLAGVFTSERALLGFGDVTYQLGYLGDAAGGETEIEQSVTASFLPVPGREPEQPASTPTLLEDPLVQGVYAGQVDFDRAGTWGLRVLAEIDGEVREGQTTFIVAEEPAIVDVGDPAPRSQNLTIADVEAGRAEPVMVDSRAQDPGDEIPAPHLHDATVAEALDAGRPVVVAIATPVYCVSQFCGPLAEELADTAREYEDRVEVVHIEVWEDFDDQVLNDAAAEWIQTEAGGNEPWVFLVDGDGTVVARWDNVLDLAELEAELDALPVLQAGEGA